MVKQTVDVFVRVRPKHPDLPSGLRVLPAAAGGVLRVIEANVPRGSNKGGWVNNTTERLQFTFQQVFDETASQEDVYSAVVAQLVTQFLAGVNCTVLAYGQTGSGKTYSMVGGGKYRDRGVIPRAIRAIFTALAAQAAGAAGGDRGSCALYVSYCEIYEEKVFDLLDRANAERPIDMWPRVQIREGADGELHIGLRSFATKSEQDVLNLLFLGNVHRQTAETPMNHASSRSHCIFSLVLEARAPGSDVLRVSKIHFVDLAGSERVFKTGAGSETTPRAVLAQAQAQLGGAAAGALPSVWSSSSSVTGSGPPLTPLSIPPAGGVPLSASALSSGPPSPTARGNRGRSASSSPGMPPPAAAAALSGGGGGDADSAVAGFSAQRGGPAQRRPASAGAGSRRGGSTPIAASPLSVGGGGSVLGASSAASVGGGPFFSSLAASSQHAQQQAAYAASQAAMTPRMAAQRAQLLQREGKYINLSLHYLEQVIIALQEAGTRAAAARERAAASAALFDRSSAASGAAPPPPPPSVATGGAYGGGHVPYRNSALTSVLRDSLGGNCHTVFLATLNPEAEFADESVSTCRFAARCCQLTTEVVVNESRDLAAAVLQLERERDALRAQLALEMGARTAAEAALQRAGLPLPPASLALAAAAASSSSGLLQKQPLLRLPPPGPTPLVAAASPLSAVPPQPPLAAPAPAAAATPAPPYVLEDEAQRGSLEERVAAYIRARDIDVPFPLAPTEDEGGGSGGRGAAAAAEAAVATAHECLRRTVAVLGLADVSEGYAAAAMLREAMRAAVEVAGEANAALQHERLSLQAADTALAAVQAQAAALGRDAADWEARHGDLWATYSDLLGRVGGVVAAAAAASNAAVTVADDTAAADASSGAPVEPTQPPQQQHSPPLLLPAQHRQLPLPPLTGPLPPVPPLAAPPPSTPLAGSGRGTQAEGDEQKAGGDGGIAGTAGASITPRRPSSLAPPGGPIGAVEASLPAPPGPPPAPTPQAAPQPTPGAATDTELALVPATPSHAATRQSLIAAQAAAAADAARALASASLASHLSAAVARLQASSHRDLLGLGGLFLKHGRRGRPHTRFVWLDADGVAIHWCSTSGGTGAAGVLAAAVRPFKAAQQQPAAAAAAPLASTRVPSVDSDTAAGEAGAGAALVSTRVRSTSGAAATGADGSGSSGHAAPAGQASLGAVSASAAAGVSARGLVLVSSLSSVIVGRRSAVFARSAPREPAPGSAAPTGTAAAAALTAAREQARDDACFSLVAADRTLDLEVMWPPIGGTSSSAGGAAGAAGAAAASAQTLGGAPSGAVHAQVLAARDRWVAAFRWLIEEGGGRALQQQGRPAGGTPPLQDGGAPLLASALPPPAVAAAAPHAGGASTAGLQPPPPLLLGSGMQAAPEGHGPWAAYHPHPQARLS